MREKKGSVSLEGLVNWHLGCKTQCIYKVHKLHTGESAPTGTSWAVPCSHLLQWMCTPQGKARLHCCYLKQKGTPALADRSLSNTHQKPTAASKSTHIKSIVSISNYNPVLCCCSPYIISTPQNTLLSQLLPNQHYWIWEFHVSNSDQKVNIKSTLGLFHTAFKHPKFFEVKLILTDSEILPEMFIEKHIHNPRLLLWLTETYKNCAL